MNLKMKQYSRILLIILLVSLSSFVHYSPKEYLMSTVYGVSGIMFSVGIGLIVTFNMNGIKNKKFISDIRSNISKVRRSFILYFSISTFAYILNSILVDNKLLKTSISVLSKDVDIYFSLPICLIMIYSIIFFVVNFYQIQKLNEDIYDEMNK